MSLGISNFAVIPIGPNTASVATFADLKSAVEGNNGYTTVVLTQNIAMGSAGIIIPAFKENITIDGSANKYTLTDYSLLGLEGQTNTIYVPTSNNPTLANYTKSITLQNLVLSGSNNYGPVSVVTNTANPIAINYNNVTYNGPQFAYNQYGTINITNSSITVGGLLSLQEIAEVNKIFLYGNVSIIHQSATNSCFALTGTSPSITFGTGSNVTISIPSSLLNLLGSMVTSTSNFVFEAKPNSTVQITTTKGFVDSISAGSISQLTVGSGADVRLNATLTSSNSLSVANSLFVDTGATFYYITPATTLSGPQLTFTAASGAKSSTFNDPKLVLLYSSGNATPINYLSAGSLQITAGTMNLWQTAPNGLTDNISNTPTRIWNKDSGNLTLNAAITSTNAVSSLSHNLLSTDPITDLLSTSTFQINNAGLRMLTFGRFTLTANPMSSFNQSVSGTSSPSSAIRAYFIGSSPPNATATTNASGNYTATFTGAPSNGTTVWVMNHNNFLKARKNTLVSGQLMLQYVPSSVQFVGSTIPSSNTRYYPNPAQQSSYYVSVVDTRGPTRKWQLSLSSSSIVRVSGGPSHTLNGNFVYIDGSNTPYTISTTSLKIWSGNSNVNPSSYSWSNTNGLFLDVRAAGALTGTYSASLTWVLADAP